MTLTLNPDFDKIRAHAEAVALLVALECEQQGRSCTLWKRAKLRPF